MLELNCMGRVNTAALISPEGFPSHYLGIRGPEQCTSPLGEERFLCGIAPLVVCSSMSNTRSFTDPLTGSFASLLRSKIILWTLFKNKKTHLLLLSHIDFPRQNKGGFKVEPQLSVAACALTVTSRLFLSNKLDLCVLLRPAAL